MYQPTTGLVLGQDQGADGGGYPDSSDRLPRLCQICGSAMVCLASSSDAVTTHRLDSRAVQCVSVQSQFVCTSGLSNSASVESTRRNFEQSVSTCGAMILKCSSRTAVPSTEFTGSVPTQRGNSPATHAPTGWSGWMHGEHGNVWTRTPSLLMLQLLMVLSLTRIQGAAAGLMALTCSSVCSHGTCHYPATMGSKAIVTCHCHPGWGGEHCSIPCTLPCGRGRCVFVAGGDQQACLCPIGFVGYDCSQPGYDVATLLGLAHYIGTGTSIYDPPSPQHPSTTTTASIITTTSITTTTAAVSRTTTSNPTSVRRDSQTQTTPLPPDSSSGGGGGKKELDQLTTSTPHGSMGSLVEPPAIKHKPGRSETTGDSRTDESERGTDLVKRREILARIVENPREHVQRNVKEGSSQCMSNFVCRHGGRCVAGAFGGFRCQCKQPYFGTFCESVCPKRCYNGGRCVKLRVPRRMTSAAAGEDVTPRADSLSVPPLRYVHRCVCPVLYSGEHCEKGIGA